MVIHQPARAQPGRGAEEEVESAYQPAIPAKLRDQPSRLGRGSVRQTRDQWFQIHLIEAIEKEVRDDQVVLSSRQRRSTRVVVSIGDVFRAGASPSQIQHPRAYIDVIDARIRSGRQQCRQRTAVAIAQRQHPPRIGYIAQKRSSPPFERAPEARILKPAIPARDAIAVHGALGTAAASRHYPRTIGRKNTGLSRATSANTRTASADSLGRARSSSRNPKALASSAPPSTGRSA